MWLQSVSGHRLFFLLVVGYLGESPFLGPGCQGRGVTG
jgi:hypothetical protein